MFQTLSSPQTPHRARRLQRRFQPSRWLILLAVLVGACSSQPPARSERAVEPTATAAAPSRVLFIGNSYLYYNDSLHNHVKRIVTAADAELGAKLQYKSATIGGAALAHHPIDSHLSPGKLGIDEPFEVVILQGGSAEPLSERRRATFRANAIAYAAKIRAAGARPVLYMTHAYVPPHRRFDPNMIDIVERTYVGVGAEIEALVIPVGLAFKRAYAARPEIELHKSFDGSHPSLLGTYLAACVVYGSLYQQPCRNSSYDYFGAVSSADARFLQGIADQTVTEFQQRQRRK